MSQKHQAEAFILRAINYGERDVMVTLLTREHGRMTALAKNARSSKRFSGGIQPFRRVDAMLSELPSKELSLFLEMQVLMSYPALERSYDKITIGSYATELVREMCREGVEGAALFNLLDALYLDLDCAPDHTAQLEAILRHFELRLLEAFGATPSLDACHRCGLHHAEFERLQCSRTGEGLLCVGCRQPGEAVGSLNADTLALLHHYQALPAKAPPQLDDPDTRRQARRVLMASFTEILQKDLKSQPLVDQLWRELPAAP